MHAHAVIWIDHREAHIILFNREGADEEIVHPDHAPRHLHTKAGSRAGARVHEDPAFYQEVADGLADAAAFLVVGPANAKTEFVKYLHRRLPYLAERLSGVETMDHVTDGELLAAARLYFKKADWKMPPQTE